MYSGIHQKHMHQVQLSKVDVVNSQKFWTNLLTKPYMFFFYEDISSIPQASVTKLARSEYTLFNSE